MSLLGPARCVSRASHKIVLGAYWQGIWDKLVAWNHECHASERWRVGQKIYYFEYFVSLFVLLDHILWILVIS